MTEGGLYDTIERELSVLKNEGMLRVLPECDFDGTWVRLSNWDDGDAAMLNLSSNDYLGIASKGVMMKEFMRNLPERLCNEELLLSSTSSRLLTGNRPPYAELETLLSTLYGREAALVFNSGYHMNSGILPALTDSRSLILADKLVHASIIDGIRMCQARCIRYRHNDYAQLEVLVEKYSAEYPRIFIVTESVFSMDGDVCDLQGLVELKRRNKNIILYLDEAHAVGVRGRRGLGLAEETGTIGDIDLLCGTFGKAIASMGGYVLCNRLLKDYLVNRMRTFIFTTALPPLNVAWTKYVMEHIGEMEECRTHLSAISEMLRKSVSDAGMPVPSASQIVPMIAGDSHAAEKAAVQMQKQGFYVLPIRPPTVPEGTARLRFSITAAVTMEDAVRLCDAVSKLDLKK